ncbi:MAG: hypothetical protein ACI9W4_001296 [Rhodothermales bacterium]|jgi:hypothetical protein
MRTLSFLLLSILVSACDVVNHGEDDQGSNSHDGNVQATTVLKSTSLAIRGAAGKDRARVVQNSTGGSDYLVDPFNVTGEILSVVFPIDPAPDDGIVVFGDGRPDIAPTTAQLLPFDFADHLSVNDRRTGLIHPSVAHHDPRGAPR